MENVKSVKKPLQSQVLPLKTSDASQVMPMVPARSVLTDGCWRMEAAWVSAICAKLGMKLLLPVLHAMEDTNSLQMENASFEYDYYLTDYLP